MVVAPQAEFNQPHGIFRGLPIMAPFVDAFHWHAAGAPTITIVVVIPTYNEQGNIEPLVRALRAVAVGLAQPLTMLVVDDNSPDGTAELVRELQRGNADLHLLRGEKRGLGDAYARGFRFAIEQLGAARVVEMDADFSHHPADLPRLLKAIAAGADMAIGSRYVAGGSIPADWGWWRSLLSRQGNCLARRVAGLPRVRDCTAGYRVIRAELLRTLAYDRYSVQGYAFQIALLADAFQQHAVIREVPVAFVERRWGRSKLGWSDIVEFGCFALRLGWQRAAKQLPLPIRRQRLRAMRKWEGR